MAAVRRVAGLLGVLALGFGGALSWAWLRTGPIVPLADAAVPGHPAGVTVSVGTLPGRGRFLDIRPPGEERVRLILYPGGRVRPHAYTWIGMALAADGVRTLVPVFPLDLAVLAPHRARSVLEMLEPGDDIPWFLAGHSLGGAMAARYVLRASREDPQSLPEGLVLLGAYPPEGDDLAALTLPTLVLAAELDGLATPAEIRTGMARLPAGAELKIIEGGVHAFFGRYGPQRGDGLPTRTRAEVEEDVIAQLAAWLAGHATAAAPPRD